MRGTYNMRVFMVLASLVAVAVAAPGFSGSSGFGSSGFGGGAGGFSGVDTYAAPVSSSGGPYSSGPSSTYGAPVQAPVVHKHVYVHVPPPEPEYIRPQKPIHVPAPQKHYKIVFIKAPAPPVPTAPIIPEFPQDEQKTLIYVLVKKPEEAPEIHIPTPVPTQPSKPEVYFIRYKTQKESGKYGPPPQSTYGAPSASGGSVPNIPDTTYGGPAPQAVPASSYGAPHSG
ncbi:hypothetical protein B566_EDAN000647 [Ephemera danica]|nr:hypothetical protein B566_EDAN000647 [Ephemera danica]